MWLIRPNRRIQHRRLTQIVRINPILRACVVAVILSVFAAFVFFLIIRAVSPVDEAKKLDPQYPIQFGLWIAGGIGGVVALVVAYRRQKMAEDSIFVERFGAAAAQLGADDPAVRMAGVYAMAGVADEGTRSQRQQCVDVLCGYLRLPYQQGGDAAGNTQLVVRKPGANQTDAVHETTFKYRLHDKEVRDTTLRVLAEHLEEGASSSWSTCNIDLTGAVLGDVRLVGSIFAGKTSFARAVFTGPAWFANSRFEDEVDFEGATFNSAADFSLVEFRRAAYFLDARFESKASFAEAEFHTNAVFRLATFLENADFQWALFHTEANFSETTFVKRAGFSWTKFVGWANFARVTYVGPVDFGEAYFSRLETPEGFIPTPESVMTDFRMADYGDDSVTFVGADFGVNRVDFSGPRRWNPAAEFDWDQDPSAMPSNIRPEEWPPKVAVQEST